MNENEEGFSGDIYKGTETGICLTSGDRVIGDVVQRCNLNWKKKEGGAGGGGEGEEEEGFGKLEANSDLMCLEEKNDPGSLNYTKVSFAHSGSIHPRTKVVVKCQNKRP